ncbi:MAG TPA: SOS response-associated peptidase, partial [Longimicrobiaceae bacterium]|nr:SOS response-associated peptidase [Longimicrobiaceae bacterium]
EGAPRTVRLRWGLIPAWAKDPAIGNRMINARAETLAEKPAYRQAFAKRRCLVLADGFYEWQRVGGRKVPMRIRLASGRPFAIAGIAERWQPAGGEPVESCAIVTTAASTFMQPIHDRMPVILGRGERSRWLEPSTDTAELLELLQAASQSELDAYPVSLLVNSPANDRPGLIERE